MMKVIGPTQPRPSALPGVAHLTRASQHDGLSSLSIWHQHLAPGAQTPVHHHDCDEVVMCAAGTGEVRSKGQIESFGPHSTIILPAHCEHQISNTGATPLEIIGVLAATPVVTRDTSGVALELPWQS
ncbi:MAG TPA: cupin domain-containing protein [Aquabacterium sp.]|nr:cupin domain-containing protein [Aquabacterium sp.]